MRANLGRYTTSATYTYISAWQVKGLDSSGAWITLGSGGRGRGIIDVPVGRTLSKIKIAAQGPYDWFGVYELEAYGNPARSLFAGYQRPQNLMGIGDDDYLPSVANPRTVRMDKIRRDIRPGTRNRGVYWRYLEPRQETYGAAYASRTTPFACPAGFRLFPSSEDERVRLGANRFRCLNDGWVSGLDGSLSSDRAYGIQSSVVIWQAPKYYTDLLNCRAYKVDAYFQPQNPPGQQLPVQDWGSACAPRPDGAYDRMQDYQDIVTFLSNRYSGRAGSMGKISHFIVWNEANTQDWFDNSPAVNNQWVGLPGDPVQATLTMSAADKAIWIARYADMIRATYEAARRQTEGALVYASLTGNWSNWPATTVPWFLTRISGRELIDGLWSNLGTRVEWAIALHAYGDNQAYMGTDEVTLSGQGAVIQHQIDRLFQYRPELRGTDPALYPWVYVFNSEQGWQQVIGMREMAHQLCVGHNGTTQFRTTVGQTHFQLQRAQSAQDHYGSPAFSYGQVPIAAGADLENADYYNTYQAYKSTHPDVWRKKRNHFCCKSYGLGCGGTPVAKPGDIAGDGRADFTIFRPGNGYWHGRVTTYYDVQYGTSGDIPIDGDFNGDGKKDFAVFRPQAGTWYIAGHAPVLFGGVGDIPVVGDYNGDGRADIAVYRPSTQFWYINQIASFQWGLPGDIPVPGDYNGDGITDVALFRPDNGYWLIGGGLGSFQWGMRGDIPIQADYDGDGRDDLAVWRPGDGHWYIYKQYNLWHGGAGDIPIPADYDGDGRADLMLYRPATGYWHSRGGYTVDYHHGESTDIPILKPRGM